MTLAKLTMLLGRADEAAERLSALKKEHPGNFEIEESLAYNAWRKGDLDTARTHFDAALDCGATNWKTNWDYARLAQGDESRSVKRASALRKTIELNPDLVDARILLGNDLYRQGSYVQALVTLRQIKRVEPEQAASVFLMMAHCAVEAQLKPEAKRYIDEARKYATKQADISGVERMQAYFEGRDRVAPAPQEVASAPVTEVATAAPAEPRLTAKGRLRQLDCLGESARMQVLAGDATLRLLIRKPGRIAIRNNAGSTVNMTCGPQDTPVLVEYIDATDAEHGTPARYWRSNFCGRRRPATMHAWRWPASHPRVSKESWDCATWFCFRSWVWRVRAARQWRRRWGRDRSRFGCWPPRSSSSPPHSR